MCRSAAFTADDVVSRVQCLCQRRPAPEATTHNPYTHLQHDASWTCLQQSALFGNWPVAYAVLTCPAPQWVAALLRPVSSDAWADAVADVMASKHAAMAAVVAAQAPGHVPVASADLPNSDSVENNLWAALLRLSLQPAVRTRLQALQPDDPFLDITEVKDAVQEMQTW